MSVKQTIEQLVSGADTVGAVDFWLKQLDKDDPLQPEIVHVRARLSTLEAEQLRGTLSTEQHRIALSHINKALLTYLGKWNPGGDTGPLLDAILRLHPEFSDNHPAGPVLLYNCDRTPPARRFRRAFGANASQPFQFYFICACPDEMPQSLAKRLVYYLIEDKLDHQHNAIDFPFREDPHDRIRIENLPLGDDLEASKKRFKSYVQRRFSFADSQNFETFIETGVPKLPFKYVASVFDVPESAWDGDEGEIQSYFQWMIETFRCPHPEVPTFLFFFVVYIKNLHDESLRSRRAGHILSQIDTLCQNHNATLITELPPLEGEHLHDWLRQFDIRNPNHAQSAIDALVQSLQPADRRFYQQHQRLHMKDVETFQKLTYDTAHQNAYKKPPPH